MIPYLDEVLRYLKSMHDTYLGPGPYKINFLGALIEVSLSTLVLILFNFFCTLILLWLFVQWWGLNKYCVMCKRKATPFTNLCQHCGGKYYDKKKGILG